VETLTQPYFLAKHQDILSEITMKRFLTFLLCSGFVPLSRTLPSIIHISGVLATLVSARIRTVRSDVLSMRFQRRETQANRSVSRPELITDFAPQFSVINHHRPSLKDLRDPKLSSNQNETATT
jgi:hypothetical protein